MERLSRTELTPRKRALVSLGIEDEPAPMVSLALKDAGVKKQDALRLILSSSASEARAIARAYYFLEKAERRSVTLDHLAAAAISENGEKEPVAPARVLGMITEQMFLQSAAVTGMIASASSPSVMRAAAFFGQTLADAHSDRKMVLQATGTVPVPKTANTYLNISGNHFDRSVHVNNQVPSLEAVLGDVGIDRIIEGE